MGEWEVTAPPGESVAVLRVIGEQTATDGTHIGWINDSPSRFDGEVLSDEARTEDGKPLPYGDISPVIIDLYEKGDDHVHSYLRARGTSGRGQTEEAKSAQGRRKDIEGSAAEILTRDNPIEAQERRRTSERQAAARGERK